MDTRDAHHEAVTVGGDSSVTASRDTQSHEHTFLVLGQRHALVASAPSATVVTLAPSSVASCVSAMSSAGACVLEPVCVRGNDSLPPVQ